MPLAADAAGLGKLTVISGLGEPLNAEIELLSTTPEELSTLTAAIAPEEAYAVQGLERDAIQTSIKVEVDKKANGNPVLKLSTHQPVNDPFLDMLIQVDWATGRLLREYTVLLDPPGYSAKAANGAAAVSAPTVPSSSSAETPATENPSRSAGGAERQTTGGATPSNATPTAGGAEENAGEAEPKEYTTVAGDTLSSIARRTQIDGVSLDQMLVGLYNANEGAFAGGNMNRLKIGQIIRIPAPEELQSISQREAAQQVRVHTNDWNGYRNKLAGIVAESAPAAEDTDAQTAGGKITSAAEDKAAPPAAGPRDVVKLSKNDADTTGAGGKSMQDRINALQEEVIAKEKTAQEANERTAMLEKQIADMQKLLAVKNQALAELQKNATAGKPAEDAKQSEPAQEAAKPAAPAEAPKSATAQAPAEAPDASQALIPPATPEAKPATPAAKPKKRVVPPAPPVAQEPGLLDGLMEDPTLLAAAGGGVVLLTGGWLFLRNRRRRNLDSFEQGILTAGGLKANTVFGNTAGGTVDTGDTSFLTDFSQSTGGMIDTHDVDPIAEAEVYMAYGRDAQAEEILKDAIAKEPQRYELHIKLLEILANRKDTAAFETIAGELYSTLGSSDPTWLKIAELGQRLEPGNPLYDTKAASGAVAATGAVAAASKLEASDFENAEELNESSLDFSAGNDTRSEQPVAGPDETASSGMDFDIGSNMENEPARKPLAEMTTMSDSIFGTIQPQVEEEPAAQGLEFSSPAAAHNEEDAGLAMDFGNTVPGLEMSELNTAEQMKPAAATEPVESTSAIEDAGLNFEMPELKSEQAQGGTESETPDELPQFDQTLMMETPAAENEISLGSTAGEETSLELPDLGEEAAAMEVEEKPAAENGLDFNFDTMLGGAEEIAFEAEEEETPNPPEIDLSGISLDFGPTIDNPEDNGNGFADSVGEGESPEVETKLDLVTAYMEMGDKEGARELLDEVLKEGGPQQKERAQQMLNDIG